MSEQIQEVALTEEEKDTILSYCGPEPLLVGGQALAFWAVWFKIESPAELGDKVTTDADFVGTSKNARALPPSSKISILHPVDMLTSRLKNLQHLREKQNELGVAQAHLAIKITSAFLRTLLAAPHRRELLTWVEHIARIALDKSLGNTLDRYELDPLKSIPAGEIEVPKFQAERWPQLIEAARVARESRASRVAKLRQRLRK